MLGKAPAKICVMALCIALALPFSTADATQAMVVKPSAADPRIEKLKGDLEYVSKQEALEIQKYLKLKSESQTAANNLAALDRKIRDAEARKKSAQDQADLARSEFAAAQEKYDKAVKVSKKAHEKRKKAIVRLYQESTNQDSVPSVLSAKPEEIQNVARKSTLMKKFYDDQSSVVSDADKKASEAEEEKLKHEDARLRAVEAEEKAAEEEASLAPLRTELAKAQKESKDKLAAEQNVVNSIKAKKSSYLKQIEQITAESNALAAAIRNKQHKPIVVQPGKMRRPVGAKITSPFGMRTHPIYGDSRLHAGVDFGASYGTAIAAAKDGKVIYASSMSGYGNVIIVDHGGGISTLYAHQSSFAVSNGQSIKQGDTIGYVGATGQVTGAHLHWEVRVNGTPVDPMGYL